MTTDVTVITPLDGRTAVAVELTVNGTRHGVVVQAWQSLADLLRGELGLTGTKVGCEQGMCGTCTVLVDGAPVRACLMLAAQADGTAVETVESLGSGGDLGRLQREFASAHALQCGFCTPGFLMLATALLRGEPHPDRQRVRECLSANLCRCTGYGPIVDAVTAAGAPVSAAAAQTAAETAAGEES